MKVLKGIAASPGVSIGKAFLLDSEELSIPRREIRETGVAKEIARFEEALTHPSFANETGAPDNQRLEFLGDAVLGLCVSEILGAAYPQATEGELTRMRSSLVNAQALSVWGRREEIGKCLSLGRGARSGPDGEQTNVIADAVEALVAAVYESRGLNTARDLVREIIGPLGEDAERLAMRDPKSLLQEQVQSRGMPTPTYRVVDMNGPAHELVFTVEVWVGDQLLGRGQGRSKRLAEREAASVALAAASP